MPTETIARDGLCPGLGTALDLICAGQGPEGAAMLEKLLAELPDDRNVVGNLAFASLNLRRWDRADELYGQLEKLSGRLLGWEEQYYRAWAVAAQGQFSRAIELCESSAARSGGDARPYELAAVCAVRSGQAGRALELLRPLCGSGAPLDSPHRLIRLRIPGTIRSRVQSIWMIAAFFQRCEQNISGIPVDRSLLRTRMAQWAAGAVARVSSGTAAARLADSFLWWAWQFDHGFRRRRLLWENTAPDAAAIAAYQEVLNAVFDELLQIPLCRPASMLSASIRAQDAVSLYSWMRRHSPATSVHVGCFIGVSALLSAVALRDSGGASDGAIQTVDPYLVGSHIDPDGVFQRISARLGVERLIERHRGYFNHVLPEAEQTDGTGTGESSAGSHQVIGREILASLPPVEAFVIDGDHSPMGVAADLLLSLEYLAPGGAILLHDVQSLAGVRRGLGQFFYLERDGSGTRVQ